MPDMLHNKRRKSKGEKPCCFQRFRCKKRCKQRRGCRRDFMLKKAFPFLCATSVFSVSLWLMNFEQNTPQRHREYRGGTENQYVATSCATPRRVFAGRSEEQTSELQ